jgi:catechol 2,3-dioxygenase-like lactoylglutathione lyase family enzyme
MKLHHIGIEVNQLERSMLFYKALLGLHFKNRIHFLNEDIIFLEGEGVQIELNKKTAPPSSAHLAFSTDSIHKTVLSLKNKGILPADGPYTLDNGWKTVFYEGPDGETIEFIEE